MTLVHRCAVPGCDTLTMGRLCLVHEREAHTGFGPRVQRVRKRAQTPVLALGLAVLAAIAGRLWSRIG